jgi:hypothetical protein
MLQTESVIEDVSNVANGFRGLHFVAIKPLRNPTPGVREATFEILRQDSLPAGCKMIFVGETVGREYLADFEPGNLAQANLELRVYVVRIGNAARRSPLAFRHAPSPR